MEAINLLDEKASIDLDRCVGCGLCVTTCPTEVLSLVKKSPGELYIPPDKPFEAYRRIAMERGKI
jgi:electron transport complex protein RnfB